MLFDEYSNCILYQRDIESVLIYVCKMIIDYIFVLVLLCTSLYIPKYFVTWYPGKHYNLFNVFCLMVV